MSKSKRQNFLLNDELHESDSMDDSTAGATHKKDPSTLNKSTVKKGRGRSRAASTKTKESKTLTRQKNDRVIKSTNLQNVGKNKKNISAITDEISQQSASEAEEIDEFNLLPDTNKIKNPPAGKPLKTTGKRSKAAKNPPATNNIDEESPHQQKVPVSQQPKRKGRLKKIISPERSQDKIVLESQEPDTNISESVDENVEILPAEGRDLLDPRTQKRSTKRRRASSATDEDTNVSSFKRKLEEMTRKHEILQKRYDEIKDMGIKEADRNFDKLQSQIEEKTRVSNEYLASLKADLKYQISLANEAKTLKKKLSAANSEIASLQTRLPQVEILLSESQAENKTLLAKLAANRTAAASVESIGSRVPGSAVKVNGGIRMMGTAEAALAAQAAQLKEDLYSDLTGLLIRNVTRNTEKDCFDCIQTGRNGTLHFKLAAGNEKSAESYDEIQCSYTPLLDPNRDKMLMELLPDYLADEITFPRPHAAKFYARVVKALTEKPT